MKSITLTRGEMYRYSLGDASPVTSSQWKELVPEHSDSLKSTFSMTPHICVRLYLPKLGRER
jgi:hypothetical protein